MTEGVLKIIEDCNSKLQEAQQKAERYEKALKCLNEMSDLGKHAQNVISHALTPKPTINE